MKDSKVLKSFVKEGFNDADTRPLVYLLEDVWVFAGAEGKLGKGFVPSFKKKAQIHDYGNYMC